MAASYLSTFGMALAFTSLLPFEAFGSRYWGRGAFALTLTCLAGPAEGGAALRIALGLVLALPTAVLLEAAAGCVEAVDTMRGQNMAQIFDPAARIENASLSSMVKLGLWWRALDSGLLAEYCRVFSSVTRLPASWGSMPEIFSQVVFSAGSLFVRALEYLWPFALVFVALEIAGAAICRMAAMGPPTQELITLKAAVFLLTASFFDRALPFDIRLLLSPLPQ